jgi:hypothetical protein
MAAPAGRAGAALCAAAGSNFERRQLPVGTAFNLAFPPVVVRARRKHALCCVSIKGGLSDSPYWDRKRPGLLGPVLTWETC